MCVIVWSRYLPSPSPFCLFYFIFWTQKIFTRRLIIVSTISWSLLVSDSTFQLPTHNLLGLASFLTICIRWVKYEDTCSFFTTPRQRCRVSLKMWQPDPFSFNIVSRSRYDTSPRGWRPKPFPFNTIPGFSYDTSLRELHPNEFLWGFISIRIAKIVVALPSLTWPLLYLRLRPAMLQQHRQRSIYINPESSSIQATLKLLGFFFAMMKLLESLGI
jgi:hypothetical protein